MRRLKGVCARGTNGADSGNRGCWGPEGWRSGVGKVASEQRTEGSEGANPVETGDRASPAEGRSALVRTCLVGVVGPVHQEVMRLQRACEGRGGGRHVRREQRRRREAM